MSEISSNGTIKKLYPWTPITGPPADRLVNVSQHASVFSPLGDISNDSTLGGVDSNTQSIPSIDEVINIWRMLSAIVGEEM